MQNLLDQLQTLDQQFRYRLAAPADTDWFDVHTGSLPVLLSAPHACMHMRDGELKQPEEYTGAIALYLANVCDCHAMVTRYQTDEDPNWQVDSEYKSAIASVVENNSIRFVIDLHGMTNRYHMGVAVGTMLGSACDPCAVVRHFVDAGFNRVDADDLPAKYEGAPSRAAQMSMHEDGDGDTGTWRNLVVDHPRFTGGLVNQTVTRYVSEQLGLPAVQIELASIVRVVFSAANDEWPYEYHGNAHAIRAVTKALRNLVNDVGQNN